MSFNLRIESLVIERASPSPSVLQSSCFNLRIESLVIESFGGEVAEDGGYGFNLRIESLVIERCKVVSRISINSPFQSQN